MLRVAGQQSSMSEEPDSVLLCSVNTAAVPRHELLCIFGTGDLGRSLGQRLLQCGYKVVYGSRRPGSCGSLPAGTQVFVQPFAKKKKKKLQ